MIVTDQKTWDDFASSRSHSPILQSWGWGEFNTELGQKVVRLGVDGSGGLAAVATCLILNRRLGKQLYVPHGPVVDWSDRKIVTSMQSEIYGLARQEKCDYIRIEPLQEYSEELAKTLLASKYRLASSFVQQEAGWMLDLSPSPDELLAGMRKSTRYEVRQAAKMGVKVEATSEPAKIDEFTHLLRQTVARQGFAAQSENYLQAQFATLAPKGLEKLYLASYDGQVLAAAIIGYFGDSVSYLHGASVKSDVPAAYALQWQAILDAKEAGYKLYDFWGVAPNDNPKHPWAGLSLFKRGFGGYPVRYVSAWDYPLTSKYHLIATTERIRRIQRRQN